MTATEKFSIIVLFAMFDLLGIIASGFVAERYGNIIPIVASFILFIIAALLVHFGLSSLTGLAALAVLSGLAHGIVYTPEVPYLAELFPTLVRNAGVSASYQIGNALIAGTALYVMTAILGFGRIWAGAYLAVLALLGLVGVIIYRPRWGQ